MYMEATGPKCRGKEGHIKYKKMVINSPFCV